MMKKTPIQELYERIPTFPCKEGCTRCCDNWVQFAPEEEARCGGFAFDGPLCPKLKNGKGCTVYEDRPLICRLFASSVLMPCPYGYGPKEPLSEEETHAILKEYLKMKREQEEAYGKNNL